MKKAFTLLVVAALTFNGCKKDNQDPKAPEVEFGGFRYVEKDANGKDLFVEMIIKFKDVNGDIGTRNEEKTATCKYAYPDLFMYYEEFKNGVYVPFYLPLNHPDTVYDSNCNAIEIREDSLQSQLTYSVPYIEPEGNNKSVEGEISYLMDVQSVLIGSVKPQGRYRVFLKDRAGNKSKEIYTELLTLSL